ncbi:MAG: UPF0280 family protein [Firmicutes bacterium]|nr:UPF0280 family protein [Bacillota bacterium]
MSGNQVGGSSYSKRTDVDRDYRAAICAGAGNSTAACESFRIAIGESDLWVRASENIREAVEKELKFLRRQLKEYLYSHPGFQESLQPYPFDGQAPELIQWMVWAATQAGVGPMAAVAGAIAGMIGRKLSPGVSELIIENGGDIYLRSTVERIVAIYAGTSVLSNKIGLKFPPAPSGIGICTSAGRVGPSLSLGTTDATVVVSPDTALADAAATAVGNRVQKPADLPHAIDFAKTISGITGVLLIQGDKLAAWGDLEIVRL